MQYTLRKVPKHLDAALRRRAEREGKTLNDVTLEVIGEGLGLAPGATARRSVRDVLGALPPDAALDAALEDQRKIDSELWK